MKNLYIVFAFFAIISSVVAQNQDTKVADKLFQKFEFVKAINEYQKLFDNGKADNYVFKQLADCNYNIFNSNEAIKWYAKAILSSQDSEIYYKYAQMLKSNGKYEDYNIQMNKFSSLVPNDSRAISFKENSNFLSRLAQRERYNVSPLDINSNKSDFGAVLYDTTLYFTSARNDSRKKYGWNGEPFLDVYTSVMTGIGIISEPNLLNSINHKLHDGPVTISADGNTMYFSSDSFREGLFEKDKQNHLKLGRNNLYVASKVDNDWTNIKPLTFNSKDFSLSNPSLSRDGKTLYFSSNMPGSIGGVDIWKVSINGNEFGKPENLGPRVNTVGNESFPFIADDNVTLYFASSGKLGLGGLDIFQIDLDKGSEAENMGKPLNTEKDDFGFTLNKAYNLGFLSSNRNGNDDIFLATPICLVDLFVVVANAKTGMLIAEAKVSILDEKNNIIQTQNSNEMGEVRFKTECDIPYQLQVTKELFVGNSFEVQKSKGPSIRIPAPLEPIETIITSNEIVLQPILFEFDKHNITQPGAFELDKLVQVMKSNEKLIIFVKSHTDSRGRSNYNLSLSDRRAQATVQYLISKGISSERITGQGFGENEPKVICETCSEVEFSRNRRSEFLIVK
jgi:outer membrane protein OmpA-like peptidoglycan-associated protein/tetratricopeptide (TPR) repeat protein